MLCRAFLELTGVEIFFGLSIFDAALADREKSLVGDIRSSKCTLDLFLKIGGEPFCLSPGVSSGVKTMRGWMVSSTSPISSSAKGSN